MNIFIKNSGSLLTGLLGALAIYFPITASGSGAGSISDAPLFTITSVKPNVLFMVDDSGSMDFELSTPDPTPSNAGAAGAIEITAGGRTWLYFHLFNTPDNIFNGIDGTIDNRILPSWDAAFALGIADPGDPYEGIWRGRNSDYNKQYYNPEMTYEPWSGVDENGVAYGPANVTEALFDPFDADSSNQNGNTYNLELNDVFDTRRVENSDDDGISVDKPRMTYWTWNDTNADGVVDPGEQGTQITILPPPATTDYGAPSRTDCTFPCSYAEESQNFANWWQYHRRREYALKSAMAEIVTDAAGTRMGIATINSNDDNNSELPIADIDTANNKNDLMESLFHIQSFGGTPLNIALRDSGRYYEGTGGPFTTNSSPIQTSIGMCQQNFTILLTDGAYSDDDDGAFDTPNNADNGAGSNNTIFDGGPYGDSESNTLADAAMYFYERDLSNLDNNVPTQCGVDQNDAQHMVTYTVSFGLEAFPGSNTHTSLQHPVLDIAGQDCTATTVANPGWPSRDTSGPFNGDFNPQNRVNELVHAAYNGRGEYYEAENAQALTDSLSQALSSIADRTTGTGSGVAFNASSLGTDSNLYLAQFDTQRWKGDLLAFDIIDQSDIDSGSTDPLGSISSQIWSAANELDNNAWPSRNIWTHDASVSGSGGGIPFEWNQLSTAQQNDLRTNPDGVTLDDVTTGQSRLNFIHGDRSNETQNGGAFRQRDSRLGDIIHSGAVVIGVPSLGWPDIAPFPEPDNAQSYSEFRTSLSDIVREPPTTGPVIGVSSNREEIVYVGANDGMLHGFNAENGTERLAYIPSYLYSTNVNDGLHYLSDPTYTHRYSNDLTPTISDIYIDNSWKTILIGGHRAGAAGFFALDITDPSSFDTSNPVMWEFRGETGTDPSHPLGDADLGFTFSKPTIALTNEKDSFGNNRWAAIFGNGYKETGDTSGDQTASLFIVYLDPNLANGWTEGSDYIKITTNSNGGVAPNGLSTPALVDTNGDGTVDLVYAGDLAGDMWAFDLCDRNLTTGNCADDSNWDIAHKSNGNNVPLFQGRRDGSGLPTKPITTQPQIIRNPRIHNTENNQPNLIVLFGTGRYISDGDNLNQDEQTFYGVWDNGTGDRSTSSLQQQTFVSSANAESRVTSDNIPDYQGSNGPTDYGWYLDLPADGERSISNAIVRGDIVFFSTTIPSANPCDSGGSGFVMFLDAVNGSRPTESVFDFNNDGMVDDDDFILSEVGTGIKFNGGLPSAPNFLGDTIYIAGTETATGSDISTAAVSPLNTTDVGRLSWGELQQEFSNNTPAP